MDRGTEQPAPGRIPLAVAVVDRDGLVSHWSRGARRLFALPEEEALGRPALDLLPVSGALPDADDLSPSGPYAAHDGLGPDLESSPGGRLSRPASGRARLTVTGGDRVDVLWWAYPLLGPGRERLLVLAADAGALPPADPGKAAVPERIAPGFAPRADFPGAEELARRLPEILPGMSVGESARMVARILELGCPVLEFSQDHRVPVFPDRGVCRRAVRRRAAHGEPPPGGPRRDGPPPDEAPDLEYAAVRERLEFLNEVSDRTGTSLDLTETVAEVGRALVPRFTDVAGTYLREQVVAGEGFPDGVPDTTTLWHRVALEHTGEPGRWDDVVPVGEAMPFPAHTPFFQCMTTGEPVLVPRITEEAGHAVAAQCEKRDIRPLITGRSMLVVPLKARRAVLGFMILLRRPERAVFDDMDRATGAELAARAGLVLDNARRHTRRETPPRRSRTACWRTYRPG
ncbi:hypothetical protein GCM10010259_23850 [Streptomyces daghestanicus]|uniref:PAS domain-containing protein n=1 Tax=Streptomyces daghestanicus TaxID=66885 RepID=A0ABQ3Q495_9ACTN|nr:hypothetical protein GCM10010259_23850 [Streptomyces daghestanicus]GHI32050.1 hypothetical protein Sdagh_37800 [Streptomyces daghestanicus]